MLGSDVLEQHAVLALPLQGPQVLEAPEVPASATLAVVLLLAELAGEGVASIGGFTVRVYWRS